MNKFKNIDLEKYTDDEIREIIGKFKLKTKQRNKYMTNYYHSQKEKAEQGDEKAQEYMKKKREKSKSNYKKLNSKENITEERKLRNQACHLFKYWKKKGDVPKFIKNHPEKVEFLKNYVGLKDPRVKYPELFLDEPKQEEVNLPEQ